MAGAVHAHSTDLPPQGTFTTLPEPVEPVKPRRPPRQTTHRNARENRHTGHAADPPRARPAPTGQEHYPTTPSMPNQRPDTAAPQYNQPRPRNIPSRAHKPPTQPPTVPPGTPPSTPAASQHNPTRATAYSTPAWLRHAPADDRPETPICPIASRSDLTTPRLNTRPATDRPARPRRMCACRAVGRGTAHAAGPLGRRPHPGHRPARC
jgi:hypothetical protein